MVESPRSAPKRVRIALGHGRRHFGADGAVRLDQRGRHTQELGLGFVGVTDGAAQVIGTHSGDRCDHLGDHAAGARLGRGEGRTVRGELGHRGFGDVVGAFAHHQAAKSLVDESSSGLDQSAGFVFGRRPTALMRKLMVESCAVMPTSGTRPRAVRSMAWASISDSPLPKRLILR